MRGGNLNDLLALLAVGQERSFTKAAAKLGVSQSVLSTQFAASRGTARSAALDPPHAACRRPGRANACFRPSARGLRRSKPSSTP